MSVEPSSWEPCQTTVKSPAESAATDGYRCWDVVDVLTRNSAPRGAPEESKRRARTSASPYLLSFHAITNPPPALDATEAFRLLRVVTVLTRSSPPSGAPVPL